MWDTKRITDDPEVERGVERSRKLQESQEKKGNKGDAANPRQGWWESNDGGLVRKIGNTDNAASSEGNTDNASELLPNYFRPVPLTFPNYFRDQPNEPDDMPFPNDISSVKEWGKTIVLWPG